MPSIDPDSLRARDRYRLMIASIVPRPIAWVTSLHPDGRVNAAPFSYFNGVASTPPLVSVSVGRVPTGEGSEVRWKDTARNVAESGEMVVNIVSTAAAEAMVASSEVSEVDENGLETVPSETVEVPGLALARLRLECSLHTLLDLPDAFATMLIGRVLRFRVDDAVMGEDGLPDLSALDPLGRLGGSSYCRIRGPFEVERPA